MGKTAKYIKHENMLRPNPGLDIDGFHYFSFVCRGCTMRDRNYIWEGFCSSISSSFNRAIDNSYLTLEEEPSNRYDPNAIMVVCRGECFGTAGYVGKEFTGAVKEILGKCSVYRVDMVNEDACGQKEIDLIITWQ